ncbi:MAG: aminoacetone oxidase family FAD-binding enzyme [Desulfovibrionaceae bacterium]
MKPITAMVMIRPVKNQKKSIPSSFSAAKQAFSPLYQIPMPKGIVLDRQQGLAYARGMFHCDVLILGAGAAGLCCGLLAAQRGRHVDILDHGPVAARKLRISGGGRCNFTHLDAGPADYLSENPHFATSALTRFTPWDAVALFAELGLGYEEKNPGQLFCAQGAPALAKALETACTRAGARLHLRTEIRSVQHDGQLFQVDTNAGSWSAASLVLALGGPSWPSAGATDLGLRLAKDFGLKIIPPRPALVPLLLSGKDKARCCSLAGVSLPAQLRSGRTEVRDDLLFTHRGLSGPAVLQLSLHWERGTPVEIDLLPGLDLGELLRQGRNRKTLLRNHLATLLPARVAAEFVPEELAQRPLCELSNTDMDCAAQNLQSWTVIPPRSEGMDKAEVTAGGVDTRRISSKTMQAEHLPGLFVIGESLDVTGRLGGYNLHWAWASAHAAAQFV